MRIVFGSLGEMFEDGVLVDVVAARFELFAVEDEVVSEAALPDREVGCEARGEDAFDSLEGGGEVAGGEEQVDVVGHDDEGVEFVVTFGSVVL